MVGTFMHHTPKILWRVFVVGILVQAVSGEHKQTIKLSTMVVERTIEETPLTEREITCLSDNVYHEARGEGVEGWLGVIHVTLNRASSEKFPANVCDVVYQKTNNVCQYSWTCSEQLKQDFSFRRSKLYREIKIISKMAAAARTNVNIDLTDGSHFYKKVGHNSSFFTKNLELVKTIGNHKFYARREP